MTYDDSAYFVAHHTECKFTKLSHVHSHKRMFSSKLFSEYPILFMLLVASAKHQLKSCSVAMVKKTREAVMAVTSLPFHEYQTVKSK